MTIFFLQIVKVWIQIAKTKHKYMYNIKILFRLLLEHFLPRKKKWFFIFNLKITAYSYFD